MAASYSDQQFLAADATFQNRVRQSLILFVVNTIGTESPVTVAFHRERSRFAVLVMNQPDSFKVIAAQLAATNATVISDATVGGTVVLSAANAAAQAALVTDVHIDNALAAAYNDFFLTPAS